MWQLNSPSKLLQIGAVGTAVTALCCFTPILTLPLGAVGLAWLSGYLDYVLLPALAAFVGLTAYALWRQKTAKACCLGEGGEP